MSSFFCIFFDDKNSLIDNHRHLFLSLIPQTRQAFDELYQDNERMFIDHPTLRNLWTKIQQWKEIVYFDIDYNYSTTHHTTHWCCLQHPLTLPIDLLVNKKTTWLGDVFSVLHLFSLMGILLWSNWRATDTSKVPYDRKVTTTVCVQINFSINNGRAFLSPSTSKCFTWLWVSLGESNSEWPGIWWLQVLTSLAFSISKC